MVQIYGLIIFSAIFVGGGVCFWEAKRQGKNLDTFFDLVFWAIFGGLVGARLYHVIHQWPYYQDNFALIFQFWRGGLGIYGALLGAILAVFLYGWIKKIDLLIWLDIAVLGVPLGQAIGRWANFVNQELYGYPTNLPWAIYIRPSQRLPQFENFSYFHPLFLYESIWSLVVFTVVLVFSRKLKLLKGELTCLYLVLYSFGRFFIEFLKPDVWRLYNIPTAQIIGLIIIFICLILTVKRRRGINIKPRLKN